MFLSNLTCALEEGCLSESAYNSVGGVGGWGFSFFSVVKISDWFKMREVRGQTSLSANVESRGFFCV